MGLIDSIVNKIDRSIHQTGSPEGLDYLDRGSDRIVFRINDLRYGEEYKGKVVKIAKAEPSDQGFEKNRCKENIAEARTWKSVQGTEAEMFFCPVRHCHPEGHFLIMDYAKKTDDFRAVKRFRNLLKKEIGKSVDVNVANVGVHPEHGVPVEGRDGKYRMVMIDYPWGSL